MARSSAHSGAEPGAGADDPLSVARVDCMAGSPLTTLIQFRRS